MRRSLLLAMAMLCIVAKKSSAAAFCSSADTAKMVHVLDGTIAEWKTERFETDKETQVSYAVDNDGENIYLALKVPGMRTQMKMMMMGMNLYLDKKGKKREGTGIEFPVKKENSDGGGFGGRSRGGEAPDPKAMREKMAASMIILKSFGFDDMEDKTMFIGQENGVNIAFSWDDAGVLYIEYQVPLSYLGKAADLKGKPIGLGWKINGITQSTPASGPSEIGGGGSRGGGGARGGRPGGASSGVSGNSESAETRDMAKEQSFWTKYNLN